MTYAFSEDSQLLLDATLSVLSQDEGINNVLEIGCGSGEVLIRLYKRFPEIKFTGADISDKALDSARDKFQKKRVKIRLIKSDLFSNISNKFDLIIFNPPYLPNDKEFRDNCLHGGPKGNETSIKFLKQAVNHLKNHGRIILLTSSLSHPEEILIEGRKLGFIIKKINEIRFFFEELATYLFIRTI